MQFALDLGPFCLRWGHIIERSSFTVRFLVYVEEIRLLMNSKAIAGLACWSNVQRRDADSGPNGHVSLLWLCRKCRCGIYLCHCEGYVRMFRLVDLFMKVVSAADSLQPRRHGCSRVGMVVSPLHFLALQSAYIWEAVLWYGHHSVPLPPA